MSDKLESNQPWNENPETKGQNSDASNPQANYPISFILVPPNPQPSPPASAEGRQKHNTRGIVKEIFEWSAIVAAIGLMVITYLQLKDSQETRILDERAWVSAGNVNDEVSEKKDSISFSVTLRNYGKTPALNLRSYIAWRINENEIPNDVPPKDALPQEGQGMLAPDAPCDLITPPIPGIYAIPINDGKPIFVFGTVSYEDIFGHEHWMQFCDEITVNPLNKGLLTITPIRIHNSSSDDIETKQKK